MIDRMRRLWWLVVSVAALLAALRRQGRGFVQQHAVAEQAAQLGQTHGHTRLMVVEA